MIVETIKDDETSGGWHVELETGSSYTRSCSKRRDWSESMIVPYVHHHHHHHCQHPSEPLAFPLDRIKGIIIIGSGVYDDSGINWNVCIHSRWQLASRYCMYVHSLFLSFLSTTFFYFHWTCFTIWTVKISRSLFATDFKHQKSIGKLTCLSAKLPLSKGSVIFGRSMTLVEQRMPPQPFLPS